MTKINKNYILDEEQHKAKLKIILELSFTGKQPTKHFRTAFIGGQPGSGKSALTEKAPDKFTHNVVIIDPDNLHQHQKGALSAPLYRFNDD